MFNATKHIMLFFLSSVIASLMVPSESIALDVIEGGYPHAFFFRSAEGTAANPAISYEKWEKDFSRLMGIEGKVLEEELIGRSKRNPEFFTRFKKDHSEQLVLLHFNGNACDPYCDHDLFFAGHWVYFNGAVILKDIPAESGETDIHVSDADLFKTNIGRFQNDNEDIGLCELDADGKPDWHRSEQVQLLSVDTAKNIIRVKRGCYGTSPLPFQAQKAYAAAHKFEGPWGQKNRLLWDYNYSTACPRDANGFTCADIQVKRLAALFANDGLLGAFDGLEFDVLHNYSGRMMGARAADCNADGLPDAGIINDENVYGLGVTQFLEKLRAELGEKKLILADGHASRSQRGFNILNGIESEGWPTLTDYHLDDWSGGLNRHFFWDANCFPPAFNYINHKFNSLDPKQPGKIVRPEVPYGIHRLVFAAAVFTDSAICYSFVPPKDTPEELIGIWDELRCGSKNKVGWLGQPVSDPVRLAESAPNLMTEALLQNITGKQGTTVTCDGIRINAESNCDETAFRIDDIPCNGPDLYLRVTASCNLPEKQRARLMHVGIAPPHGQLITAEEPEITMCLRNQQEKTAIPAGNASLRYFPGNRIGDEIHDAYMTHPPYGPLGVGYVAWERRITVPQDGRLDLYTAMGVKSPERSDGVDFIIQAASVENDNPQTFTEIFRYNQKAHEWRAHSCSLEQWENQELCLKFIADCGPADNSTTDHAFWGDIYVVNAKESEKRNTPVKYMTWVNEKAFTSTFCFSEILSPTLDIEFIIEGGEAISVSSLSAHTHADAIYRLFEHGLVLANPSPRPYTFNLAEISPGNQYQRLSGSPAQDPKTNSGESVGAQVTLPPKDALFLLLID